jgi:hypothetical protein
MPSASDIRAGGAFTELYTKNGPLYAGLKAAQTRIKAFSASAMQVGASIMRLTAVTASPFIIGIKAASDMQETMSKFNTVFGANSEAVKKWGDEYGAQVGRSKQQIADFLAGNQDLFVPMGFDAKSAEAISKTLTTLAVDLGSFNNKADADVMGDLQAAMTGSGEVMKKYGVILSEAAVKQELVKQGMDPKNATEVQKAQARLNIILAGTTAAQGDAIRTSGGFANQMKALKASAWDAAGALGEAILPAVTSVLSRVVKIVKVIADWIGKNAALVKILAVIVGIIAAVGAGLVAFGGAGMVLSGIVSGIATAVTVFGSVLGVVGSVLGFLVSPIGLVLAGLAALAAYAFKASGAGKTLVEGLKAIWSAIMAGDFTGALYTVAETVYLVLTDLANWLGQWSSTAAAPIRWFAEQFRSIADFAGEALGAIAAAVMAGDLAAAFDVAWATIKLVWIGGLAWLHQQWTDLRFFLVDMWGQVAFAVLDTCNYLWSGMVDGFWSAVDAIVDAWKYAEKTVAKAVGWIMAKVYKISPEEVLANLEQDYAGQQAGRDSGRAARDKANQEATDARYLANQEARTDWTAGAQAKRDAALAGAQDDLEEARRRFAEAKDAAKRSADVAAQVAGKGGVEGPKPPTLPDIKGSLATQSGGFATSGALGSAESYKLMMGSRDPALAIQKDQLKTLAEIAKNTATRPVIKEAVPPKR